MKLKAEYPGLDEGPWTRWDEVKQRVGNCRRFLVWAWMALWYDSTMFAAVFMNASRSEGDMLISRIVMKDGREFDDLA